MRRGMSRTDSTKRYSACSIAVNRHHFPQHEHFIKRIYDPQEAEDGDRVLVDRIWPRGISKEKASWNEWAKEAAPSTELRRWFAHDPAKWDGFRKKYFEELVRNKEAVSHLSQLARKGKLTLLYAAKVQSITKQAALKDYLLQYASS